MNFHANTTQEDFVRWLRDAAIRGGMPTQFIDCVDALDTSDKDAEIEEIGEELERAKDDASDLYEELADLVTAIDAGTDAKYPKVWESKLEAARKALERHKEYK